MVATRSYKSLCTRRLVPDSRNPQSQGHHTNPAYYKPGTMPPKYRNNATFFGLLHCNNGRQWAKFSRLD